LRSFHEKLLGSSASTIPFADFSENLIKNLGLFIESPYMQLALLLKAKGLAIFTTCGDKIV